MIITDNMMDDRMYEQTDHLTDSDLGDIYTSRYQLRYHS